MIAAVINSAFAAGKNHLGLFNAVGSGRVLRVYRIVAFPHFTAAVVGLATTLYVMRTTTAGTGAAVAFRRLDLTDPLPPAQVTALHTFTAQPTVTANSEMAGVALTQEETAGQSNKMVFEASWDQNLGPIVLREGQGIVLQQSALVGAGALSAFVYLSIDRD